MDPEPDPVLPGLAELPVLKDPAKKNADPAEKPGRVQDPVQAYSAPRFLPLHYICCIWYFQTCVCSLSLLLSYLILL